MRCSSKISNHKYEKFPPKIPKITINFNYYFSKKFRALRYSVKMRSYKAVGDRSTIFEELATLSGLAPWRVGTGSTTALGGSAYPAPAAAGRPRTETPRHPGPFAWPAVYKRALPVSGLRVNAG